MAFLKSLRHADTGDSPRSDISLPSSPGILTHFLHIFAVSKHAKPHSVDCNLFLFVLY